MKYQLIFFIKNKYQIFLTNLIKYININMIPGYDKYLKYYLLCKFLKIKI